MQALYDSLDHILSLQRISLSRGHSKTIFSDPSIPVMYKCLGVRANRSSTGIFLDFDNWAERIAHVHWQGIMRMVCRAELLFESFSTDEVIQHI